MISDNCKRLTIITDRDNDLFICSNDKTATIAIKHRTFELYVYMSKKDEF